MRSPTVVLMVALLAIWPVCARAGTPIDAWGAFERTVRDGTIARAETEFRLGPLLADVSSYIQATYQLERSSWSFPLAGYDRRAVNARDYRPEIGYGPYGIEGYDFLDGNRHGGHPAFDFFIRDKDRDSRDDATGEPVRALSMADAVVVSVNSGWTQGSELRGGNYVWLYSPLENKFFYYAHLDEVLVEPGRLVRGGEPIGTVGRTGLLAAAKRSPTHIHVMVLEPRGGVLAPYDYLRFLPRRTAQ